MAALKRSVSPCHLTCKEHDCVNGQVARAGAELMVAKMEGSD